MEETSPTVFFFSFITTWRKNPEQKCVLYETARASWWSGWWLHVMEVLLSVLQCIDDHRSHRGRVMTECVTLRGRCSTHSSLQTGFRPGRFCSTHRDDRPGFCASSFSTSWFSALLCCKMVVNWTSLWTLDKRSWRDFLTTLQTVELHFSPTVFVF